MGVGSLTPLALDPPRPAVARAESSRSHSRFLSSHRSLSNEALRSTRGAPRLRSPTVLIADNPVTERDPDPGPRLREADHLVAKTDE
jgi:hypothetical protein